MARFLVLSRAPVGVVEEARGKLDQVRTVLKPGSREQSRDNC